MASQAIPNVQVSSRMPVPNTTPVPFVSLVALLVLIFVTLIVSALAGAHIGYSTVHPNPFADYEALWPGQSIMSVSAFAQQMPEHYLSCVASDPPRTAYPGLVIAPYDPSYFASDTPITCQTTPKQGPFNQVTVTIDHDHVVELEFVSDNLPGDTLSLYWGAPNAILRAEDKQELYLSWSRISYSAVAVMDASASVVRLVTLTMTR